MTLEQLEKNEILKSLKSTPNDIVSSSRISGFAKMSPKERVQALINRGLLNAQEASFFGENAQSCIEQADRFIENCIGTFELPLGVATNFVVDGEEVLVPMAVEESSVIAAASFGAKLARSTGGFKTTPIHSIATCQVQFFTDPHVCVENYFTQEVKDKIARICAQLFPKLELRGGGFYDAELRHLSKPGSHVIHIHVDTCEAMGANIVNSIAEEVGKQLPFLIPCSVGTKILTNLTLNRVITSICEVDVDLLARESFSGLEAAQRICSVWEFAWLDPFRAATHNKGVMNGIDPVVIATGNDWRAVEAGAHAYASLSGSYKPLTHWEIVENKILKGTLTLPLALGTVGGVTKLHPSAQACLSLMGKPNSARLAAIIASVGLAQNLSALRALACEGIQKGHMALHEKNLEMMRQYDHLPALSIVTEKNS